MSLKKKIALSFIINAAIIAILAMFEHINMVRIKSEIRFLELTDAVRTKSLQVSRHEQHQYRWYKDPQEDRIQYQSNAR
jgi:hypothetical protein